MKMLNIVEEQHTTATGMKYTEFSSYKLMLSDYKINIIRINQSGVLQNTDN